jgi:hypothetical protein
MQIKYLRDFNDAAGIVKWNFHCGCREGRNNCHDSLPGTTPAGRMRGNTFPVSRGKRKIPRCSAFAIFRPSMSHDRLMRWVHRLAVCSGLARLVDFYLAGLHAEQKLNSGSRLLFRIRHSPWYPLLVGGLAIISAATSLYPFGPVIVAATVFAPNRWRAVIVSASLGAVSGATVLALFVQSVGVGLVDVLFPVLRESAIWSDSAYWVNHHGSLALSVIAALPVPQMPAIILAALSEMGLFSIALALLVGKTLKYTVYVLGVLLVLRAIRHVAEWHEPES